jgi:hypothetical protein
MNRYASQLMEDVHAEAYADFMRSHWKATSTIEQSEDSKRAIRRFHESGGDILGRCRAERSGFAAAIQTIEQDGSERARWDVDGNPRT